MKRWLRGLFAVSCAVCVALLGTIGYYGETLPDRYTVSEKTTVEAGRWVTLTPSVATRSVTANEQSADFYTAQATLFHLFPVKDVTVSVSDRAVVDVMGTPFGIKLYTDGVLVVGMTDVVTAAGEVNPAAAAGICIGDTILSVNGKQVWTNQEVSDAINACGGKPVTVRLRRDGVEFTASFLPARPTDESGYRAGLWVRDSTAGVGTMTFYDEASGQYGGLGHAICDTDTGTVLSVSDGEVVPARIYGVTKSTKGSPGELSGGFESGVLGKLCHNGATGLYGTLYRKPAESRPYAVAHRQEVHTGEAKMLTTIDGETPQWYTVNIDKVKYNASSSTRHMVVRITDQTLLNITGGIVQGMSGSPILQNGKLIGAITHVLVDDPTTGYAIFAENMLETAQSVASENKLKDAS